MEQPEKQLENELIKQLVKQGYNAEVSIKDEKSLIKNLKEKLEEFNGLKLTDDEFELILNELSKGKVFDKALMLRSSYSLKRVDGKTKNIFFTDSDNPEKNIVQVSNQITMHGRYENRYDVTIFVNGLPLAAIELKRRGMEKKQAFNQVNRYRKHTYSAGRGLFEFIQIFVISNGANTKYYANTVGYNNKDKSSSFEFTSFWANEANGIITDISKFADTFLEKTNLINMLTKFSVTTSGKELKILRPYQVYAAKRIAERVENWGRRNGGDGESYKGGYIWHSTGSGKTLTSFKAAELIMNLKDGVDRVVFVVDRQDLDSKTIRDFNEYKKDSVDTTDSTKNLLKHFNDPSQKLIVTTIQKLGKLIKNQNRMMNKEVFNKIKDDRTVLIFDECHRSTFGDVYKEITKFFTDYKIFGFTGTPILAIGEAGTEARTTAGGIVTTGDLFGERLHKYILTDAIRDNNVLKFVSEHVGRYQRKGTKTEIDIDVNDIDTKEVLESGERARKIVKWILNNHSAKTHDKKFNAIFASPSVDMAIKYYDLFEEHQENETAPLNIAAIFHYGVNENDEDADSNTGEIFDEFVPEDNPNKINEHSRDSLEIIIRNYNKKYKTNFSTKDTGGLRAYNFDIGKKMLSTEIDILIVVNMYLTGFDAPKLNTLYVDKNLRYHGLIQAFSRTNRILNETKSHGNIVNFRNLKERQDEALAIYGNGLSSDIVFIKPFDELHSDLKSVFEKLLELVPTPKAVDNLADEASQTKFVQFFRTILKLINELSTFADFDFIEFLNEFDLTETDFNNYKSKYLDLTMKSRECVEGGSILDDIDFELELTNRDIIDVSYILNLISDLIGMNENEKKASLEKIYSVIRADEKLRSKEELIKKFIEKQLPYIASKDLLETNYDDFLENELEEKIKNFSKENNVRESDLRDFVSDFQFGGSFPLPENIRRSLTREYGILEIGDVTLKIERELQNMFDVYIS